MRLAAGYMAQAYVEHVLVNQVENTSALEELFAWGFDPNCWADEGSDEWEINEMFRSEDISIRVWHEIKEEHLRAVSDSR